MEILFESVVSGMQSSAGKRGYFFVKRMADIVLSFTGLIALSPLMLALALWIKLDSRGPVLFRQKRVGKNGKHFNILKFRTMRTDTPSEMPTHLLTGVDSFITPIGKFLRKSSLDELPQLWNILIGQMSIVGPRPALWNQYDLIAERERYGANAVRPGLTGLAQVSGRDELEIATKAQLDGEYVQNCSLLLDAKLLFKTAASVICMRGIVEGRK